MTRTNKDGSPRVTAMHVADSLTQTSEDGTLRIRIVHNDGEARSPRDDATHLTGVVALPFVHASMDPLSDPGVQKDVDYLRWLAPTVQDPVDLLWELAKRKRSLGSKDILALFVSECESGMAVHAETLTFNEPSQLIGAAGLIWHNPEVLPANADGPDGVDAIKAALWNEVADLNSYFKAEMYDVIEEVFIPHRQRWVSTRGGRSDVPGKAAAADLAAECIDTYEASITGDRT